MKIEFVDLKRQYLTIKDEIDYGIHEVIESTEFVRGKYVKEFEHEFAAFIGTKHCISCGNGTDALEIALRSLQIGPGDQVIVPANSFIASSEAVTRVGAEIVFADCEPGSYLVNIELLEKLFSPRTKAIIAVHLYGQTVNMDKLFSFTKKYNLHIIEDCAQSHGATFNGRRAGSFGIISCFSFYPGKNLGAYGDGGAILTSDEAIAGYCRLYSNHGASEKYNHLIEGCNSRLDAIQAKILTIKLKHLPLWNQKRRNNAELYNSNLDRSKYIVPCEKELNMHVYHLYVIKCKNRDEILNALKSVEISALIHYPIALPFLQAYKYKKLIMQDFPEAASNQNCILSLPMYPELKENEIIHICTVLNNF